MSEGKYYGLNAPLIFLDMQITQVDQWGNGDYRRKASIKVHCCHKFFNATDGIVKFDQDLDIYYYRDWVFKMLAQFQPSQCGVMTLVDEPGSEQHDMINDYIMEFSCLHTDSLVDQPINGSVINYDPTAIPPVNAPDLDPTITITDQP